MVTHRTTIKRHVATGAFSVGLLWIALVMSACIGDIGGTGVEASGSGSETQGGPDCSTPPELVETKKIMDGLSPQCAGCHRAENGGLGFFTSLDTFVNLMVANPSLVVPGAPDESRLVKLLEGTAAGTVTQMPLAGKPYADLPNTELTMEQVRSWITDLQPLVVSEVPSRDAPTSSRLPAPIFEYGVPELLGITPAQHEQQTKLRRTAAGYHHSKWFSRSLSVAGWGVVFEGGFCQSQRPGDVRAIHFTAFNALV